MKKKCPACAKKIERKFSYCPYCGVGFKAKQDRENFGMLGRMDSGDKVNVEQKLPFGMDKIMGSLIKQLESQMGNMNLGEGVPKNVKIRVARSPMQNGQVVQRVPEKKIEMPVVSEEESERRAGLPKVEVEAKVRRLADRIIYEIDAPGVHRKADVVVTALASGLEIKAYSKDKCYVKFIPLKVELIGYSVEREKVFVELRG
jgi:hypothetical protein